MHKSFFLKLLLLLLLLPDLSRSQEIVVLDKDENDISINHFAAVYKNPKTAIRDINKVVAASDADFETNANFQEVNYGFDQSSGWCRFKVKNNSENRNWILKVHQARVDSLQLYVQIGDKGLFKYPVTGHFQSINDRSIYSVNYEHLFVLESSQTATFYLYTQRNFSRHAAILSIQKQKYATQYNGIFTIYIGIILGIVFLAGLVGIVLCLFVYKKVYVYYSVYCFGFLILLLSATGFLHGFFNAFLFEDLMNNANTVFYYWVVGWHILFTIELLGIDPKTERRLYKTGYFFGILFCVFGLVLLLPVPDFITKYLSRFSFYIVFFADLYIPYSIFIKIKKSKAIAYFYLAGFLFTMIAASILMLAGLQVISGINQKADFFFITPVVEILFMVLGLGIHFSRTVKEKLNAQIQLNETQNEIIGIQEDERKRIAQDLHDDVGNSLMALKNIMIHNMEAHNIEKEIDYILEDIRSISHNLMPVDFKEYDLTDIVRQTINKFQNYPTTQFECDQTGEAMKLKPVAELVIYRIINELITNINKHAQATHALIQLIYQEESLVVMVEDDGQGMKDKNTPNEGLGLSNIKHRVAYINAQINIESDAKGTLVIIEIPYEANR